LRLLYPHISPRTDPPTHPRPLLCLHCPLTLLPVLYGQGHADVNRAGQGKMTPLHWATHNADHAAVRYLLSRCDHLSPI